MGYCGSSVAGAVVCVCASACASACVYVYVRICARACVCARVCGCMCVHECVWAGACLHACSGLVLISTVGVMQPDPSGWLVPPLSPVTSHVSPTTALYSLAGKSIGNEAAELVGHMLLKNATLISLDLSGNMLMTAVRGGPAARLHLSCTAVALARGCTRCPRSLSTSF
jgi:hypothetical protein